MKKRQNAVDRYSEEVYDFATMLDSKDNKTADDCYHEIAAKGISIVCFLLRRISDKFSIIIGFLLALLLIRR